MRGKKTDTDFVAEFINTCAISGKLNPQDICNEAEMKISAIDFKIKEVEELKKIRSKLTDVINTLSKKTLDKSKDKLTLSFYGISNLVQARIICGYLQTSSGDFEVNYFAKEDYSIIKDLLSIDVLKRQNNLLIKGAKFNDFLNFVNEFYKV